MRDDVWVMVPAFDEEGSVGAVVSGVPKEMRVLVVDDGSGDRTAEEARAAGARVLMVPFNRGRGAAVKAGIAFLAGLDVPPAVVVIMDADGQHPPEKIPELLAPILSGQAEVTLGVRYNGARKRGNAPLNRYLVNRVVTTVVRRVTTLDIWDPFCGFRAFRWEALQRIELTGDRYETELEMLFEIERLALKAAVVQIPVIYPPQHSKMGQLTSSPALSRAIVITSYARTIRRGVSRL